MRCSSEMGWDTRRSSKMEGGTHAWPKAARKRVPPLRVFLHLSLAHKINQYKVLRLLDPCTDTGADSLLFLFLFSDPSNCTDVQLRVQPIGEQCLLADVGNSSFYPGNLNS